MEVLYKKLYDKYRTLRDKKECQFDELNHDQEVKLQGIFAALHEMTENLKSENERLCGQVDELKNKLDSVSASTDQYQKLLIEERQKYKELSEELSRQKAEHNECSRCTMCKEIGHGQENSDDTPGQEKQAASVSTSMKKRKFAHISEGTDVPYVDVELDHPADRHVFGDRSTSAPPCTQQPVYCQRKMYHPGADAMDTVSPSCLFQYLVEFVVGMKISATTQSNELCILAHDLSSGYSFTLTWITNSKGEVELLYRVLSLGTFERVAPQWMKETLKFSPSMCSVFFERVSRVIDSSR